MSKDLGTFFPGQRLHGREGELVLAEMIDRRQVLGCCPPVVCREGSREPLCQVSKTLRGSSGGGGDTSVSSGEVQNCPGHFLSARSLMWCPGSPDSRLTQSDTVLNLRKAREMGGLIYLEMEPVADRPNTTGWNSRPLHGKARVPGTWTL